MLFGPHVRQELIGHGQSTLQIHDAYSVASTRLGWNKSRFNKSLLHTAEAITTGPDLTIAVSHSAVYRCVLRQISSGFFARLKRGSTVSRPMISLNPLSRMYRTSVLAKAKTRITSSPHTVWEAKLRSFISCGHYPLSAFGIY